MSENSKIILNGMRDVRSFAFHILYAAESFDYAISVDEIVQNFRDGYNVEIEDDSKAILMAFNTIQDRQNLDEIIKPLLKNWKIDRLGVCTLLILRMAIWEIQQKLLPPSIIINEAIELAKSFAEKDSYKFVNGILDEVCKNLNITDQDEAYAGVNNHEPEDNSGIK